MEKINNKRKVVIDYLYLDLNKCERCIGTDEVLDEVIEVLKPSLELAGYEIIRHKIEMKTSELAIQYKFLSSPTIRVNGIDICLVTEENNCGCCSDIVGVNIDCRVFRYGDETYETPPKEMLADAILRTLFSTVEDNKSEEDYVMPENLNLFYTNKNLVQKNIIYRIEIYDPSMCCSTGVCGPNFNNELLRISTDINNLNKKDISVIRHNLSQEPQAFVSNILVSELLKENGAEILPITLLDNKVVKTRNYPTSKEMSEWLGTNEIELSAIKEKKIGNCCKEKLKCC